MNGYILETGFLGGRIGKVKGENLLAYRSFIWEESQQEGKICRGIVKKVMPGLEAAFVDIGEEKNGYLPMENLKLKGGQEVLVQVKRGAQGEKGAKLTSKISIPGRNIVLLPGEKSILFSSKLEEEVKLRLKKTIGSLKSQDHGIILRTESKESNEADLKEEYEELLDVWNNIKKEFSMGMGSKVLWEEEETPFKFLRDTLEKEDTTILINDKKYMIRLKEFLKKISRNDVEVRYLEGNILLNSEFNKDIRDIFSRKIALKKGGSLVFDSTEAFEVIDVNSGGFAGGLVLEETALEVNLEAAKSVVKQIQLRDLGGIILVDFIDMKSENAKKKLIEAVETELKKDKKKASVVAITELGIMQIIRKKSSKEDMSQSLKEILFDIEMELSEKILIQEKTECSICIDEEYIMKVKKYISILEKKLKLKINLKKQEKNKKIFIIS